MIIKIYDYLVDEETEIDTRDILRVSKLNDTYSIIENNDGLAYKVSTKLIKELEGNQWPNT